MWRTCRCCCRRCCSLPIERAGRCRSQSRHGRDSRHAKSPMTDAAVCERGFRAMEIGESLAESAHLGFSSDFSRERPETWPRLYPEASPAVSTWRELTAYLVETLRLALLFKSYFYSGKCGEGRDFEIYFLNLSISLSQVSSEKIFRHVAQHLLRPMLHARSLPSSRIRRDSNCNN